ncbi:MFS transporter [Paenibacillus thiaminolyticus]|nr:MFS transporter [Paenibacillus thiaminolyticus]
MLTAVAWNPVILGIFRFLTGVGVSAALINSSTYISEFFPSASRGKCQGIALVVGLLGIPVTGWVSTLFIGLAPSAGNSSSCGAEWGSWASGS